MSNIEELMDKTGQTVKEWKSGTVYFTIKDLTYPYGQLSLGNDTSKHDNFSLVGETSTGTYRFKTGFPPIDSRWVENPLVLIDSRQNRLNHDDGGIPTGSGFHIERIP